MSSPSNRESHAGVSSKSDKPLLEGQTSNDSASFSIRKLPVSMPIQTGTTEAVGMNGIGCE